MTKNDTPAPQTNVRPLEWRPYPEDGGRMFEGQNQQRRYLSRALTPWGSAIFVMEKDGVYTLEGSCEVFFATEQAAKDAAQAEFDAWILASVESPSPQPNLEGWTKVPDDPTLELLRSINIDNQVLAYENGRYYNAWFTFEPGEGGWFWTDDADSEPNPSHYRALGPIALAATATEDGR